jgi:hypothetical protein
MIGEVLNYSVLLRGPACPAPLVSIHVPQKQLAPHILVDLAGSCRPEVNLQQNIIQQQLDNMYKHEYAELLALVTVP